MFSEFLLHEEVLEDLLPYFIPYHLFPSLQSQLVRQFIKIFFHFILDYFWQGCFIQSLLGNAHLIDLHVPVLDHLGLIERCVHEIVDSVLVNYGIYFVSVPRPIKERYPIIYLVEVICKVPGLCQLVGRELCANPLHVFHKVPIIQVLSL